MAQHAIAYSNAYACLCQDRLLYCKVQVRTIQSAIFLAMTCPRPMLTSFADNMQPGSVCRSVFRCTHISTALFSGLHYVPVWGAYYRNLNVCILYVRNAVQCDPLGCVSLSTIISVSPNCKNQMHNSFISNIIITEAPNGSCTMLSR